MPFTNLYGEEVDPQLGEVYHLIPLPAGSSYDCLYLDGRRVNYPHVPRHSDKHAPIKVTRVELNGTGNVQFDLLERTVWVHAKYLSKSPTVPPSDDEVAEAIASIMNTRQH